MNRDAKGRFTKAANQTKISIATARDKMKKLEKGMQELDMEIEDLTKMSDKNPGDPGCFRKVLIKQKEQIDLMLDALDLLDNLKAQRLPKEKTCKCGSCKKVKDIPDDVMELLEPILEELDIDLDDIEKVGVIKVKADPEELEDIPDLDDLPFGDMAKDSIKELLGKKFPMKPKGRKKK